MSISPLGNNTYNPKEIPLETQATRENLFKELGLMGKTVKPEGENDLASKETFLKLFLAQLEHQNPLEDNQDPTKFVSQLAQFTQVESTQKMFDELHTIATSLKSNKVVEASTLLGKKIQVPSDQANIKNLKQTDEGGATFDPIKAKVILDDIQGHGTEGVGNLYYDDVVVNIEDSKGVVVMQHSLGKNISGGVLDVEFDKMEEISDYFASKIDKVENEKFVIKAKGKLGNKYAPAQTLTGLEITGVKLINNDLVAETSDGNSTAISDLSHIYSD